MKCAMKKSKDKGIGSDEGRGCHFRYQGSGGGLFFFFNFYYVLAVPHTHQAVKAEES